MIREASTAAVGIYSVLVIKKLRRRGGIVTKKTSGGHTKAMAKGFVAFEPVESRERRPTA